MSKLPVWISKKALLLLHELSLSQFGGAPGLRDDGLLNSALGRAQNLHLYNAKATVAALAAPIDSIAVVVASTTRRMDDLQLGRCNLQKKFSVLIIVIFLLKKRFDKLVGLLRLISCNWLVLRVFHLARSPI